MKPAGILSEILFWGGLLAAAVSDRRTKEVYDVTFYPALAACCVQLAAGREWTGFWELMCFAALQLILFRRMYGGADCLAFTMCAAYTTAHGGGLLEALCVMLDTFLLLFPVQLFKRNINRQGNLKEPVALIPYIFGAMVLRKILGR